MRNHSLEMRERQPNNSIQGGEKIRRSALVDCAGDRTLGLVASSTTLKSNWNKALVFVTKTIDGAAIGSDHQFTIGGGW